MCLPCVTSTIDLMTSLIEIKWIGLRFLYINAEHLFFRARTGLRCTVMMEIYIFKETVLTYYLHFSQAIFSTFAHLHFISRKGTFLCIAL